MQQLIKLDASAESCVVTCSCGWRDVGTTRADARQAADRHRQAQHVQAKYAADWARRQRLVRT